MTRSPSAPGTARATVEYGPFDDRDTYVVKLVDEPADDCGPRTFTALAHIMKLAPKFAIGDKVVTRTGRHDGSLVAGPFTSRFGGRTFWVVEHADGKHEAPSEESITKLSAPEPVKVGDRVRVLRATYAEDSHGKTGVVTSTSETWRERADDLHLYIVELDGDYGSIHVAELERVEDENTYVHDGVTYDLTAKYADKDGDVWRLKRVNGEVRARMEHDGEDPTEVSNRLTIVAESWGPLTRV